MSAVDGRRLPETFLTGAGAVTEAGTGFAPSRVAITGVASSPNVMRSPDQQKSVIYVSTSGGNDGGGGGGGGNGNNGDNLEKYDVVDTEIGRQSWRQLEFQ